MFYFHFSIFLLCFLIAFSNLLSREGYLFVFFISMAAMSLASSIDEAAKTWKMKDD